MCLFTVLCVFHMMLYIVFFFQAEDGIRDLVRSRGLGDVYKRQDKNNWWATYAFWVFQLFGHANAKIMDGGRMKWVAEGRELTREIPSYPATTYVAQKRNDAPVRAFRNDVLKHAEAGLPLGLALIQI